MFKKIMLAMMLVILTSCSVSKDNKINEDGSYVVTKDGIKSDFSKEDNQKIIWYSDFLCPDCHRAYNNSHEFIKNIINEGKLEVKYYPLGFLNKYVDNEYSTRSAAWNLGIVEYSPESVENFVTQLSEDSVKVEDADEKFLEEVAKKSGVSDLNIKKIKEKMEDYKAIVEKSTKSFVDNEEYKKLTKDGRMFVPFIIVDGKVLNGESEDVDNEIINPIKDMIPDVSDCGDEDEKGCTPN